MVGSSSFFSDPKMIISLLALIVAFLSLIWTFCNQWSQNRRWHNLNTGNPEIREIRLLNWKELSKEEASTTVWGYDPIIYLKGEASNKCILPYYLSLLDVATNSQIPNTNPVFTLEEIENELNRVGFTGEFLVCRFFKPLFEIENMGKTEVKDLSIDVDAKISDNDWVRIFSSNVKINLTSSQKSNVTFSFNIPIEIIIPKQIVYKVHFSYLNYKCKIIKKVIVVKWTSDDNFWSYEAVN
jgi:hypothetical protein